MTRCYFDYTCGHSYRAWQWLRDLGRPVDWRTFSLKELNRVDGEPPAFERLDSISVLALALSHAARTCDFDRYHASVFEAMHAGHVDAADLLRFAAEAGVAVHALDRPALFASVAAEHAGARERWGVRGTPTLILDDRPAFLRVERVPPAGDGEAWLRLEAGAGDPAVPIDVS